MQVPSALQLNFTLGETSIPSDWLNALSTLLGVLLGAALTYFVTSRFEEKRLKEEQLGRAYALLFALQKMTDDLFKLHRQILVARARAAAGGFEGPLWAILDDVVGYSGASVAITPEALALVAMTKDVDLLMGVREVETAHCIYLEALSKISQLRAKLEDSGLQIAAEGNEISYAATSEEYPRIAPTIIRLQGLSDSIEERLPHAVEHARQIGERLGPQLKKHFGFKHFMSLTVEIDENDAMPEADDRTDDET